jgi:hypothetical protein
MENLHHKKSPMNSAKATVDDNIALDSVNEVD